MQIKLLTYNVQSWDVTERRIKGITNLIKRYNPDVIFLQEVTQTWFKILRKEFSSVYIFTGRDRLYADKDALKRDREKNCVLFKKDRFNLIWSHTYWLGPDMKHPSKFEGSVFKRVFTVTKLLDKKNNKKFQAISTHFDYLEPDVRTKQAEVLSSYLKSQKDQVLLAGDFNGGPTEDFYKIMTDKVVDVGEEFKQTEITYHAYDRYPHERIDYIFKSKDICAKEFKLIKDQFEGLPPSDHYPLFALVELK